MASDAARVWAFAGAPRIVVGVGAADGLAELVAGVAGPRVLVVHGRHTDPAAGPLATLPPGTTRLVWSGEPSVASLDRALAGLRAAAAPDVVVGWGGGAVLDAAKAIGALLTGGSVGEHLAGRPLPGAGVPVVAVPTTAGTGAEVTANVPVRVPDRALKISLRGPTLRPALAVVDPLLSADCPPDVTAAAGADALTQCLEALVTPRATPLSLPFARDGLERAGRSMGRAVVAGDDLFARTDMALAATLSGLALASSGLGAVHGLAAAVGGLLDAPHGAICAAGLVATTQVTVRALRERDPAGPALARYDEAARLLVRHPEAGPDDLVDFLRAAVAAIGTPTLADLGLTPRRYDEVVAGTRTASSTAAHPIVLTDDELREIVALSAS